MLSTEASFDRILDLSCLPAIPLSFNEHKLVKKGVELARMLQNKSAFLSSVTYLGRKRLLLCAIQKISTALQESRWDGEHLLDAINILAHFSLDYLADLEWIEIEELQAKVMSAKKLIVLFGWRKRTRKEPAVDVTKLLAQIEPFIHAIEKREAFNLALSKFDFAKTKSIIAQWRLVVAQRRMKKFQKAIVYSRWKHSSKRAITMSRAFSRFTRDRVNPTERGRMIRGSSEEMLQFASNMSLKAKALTDWRSITRLQRFSDRKHLGEKKALFKVWTGRTSASKWLEKTADFHNKIRVVRPIFSAMHHMSTRCNEALEYLSGHAKLKKYYEVFSAWRRAVNTRSLKRKYFDVLARKSVFLTTANQHAAKLNEITTKLRFFQAWKLNSAKLQIRLKHLGERVSHKKVQKASPVFEYWRVRTKKFEEQQQMVHAWYGRETKKEIFSAWKAKAIVEHNCKALHLRNTWSQFFGEWKGALDENRTLRVIAWRTFTGWRQHTKSTQALKLFTGSNLIKYNAKPEAVVPSNVLNRVTYVKTFAQATQVNLLVRHFKTWYGRVSKPAALEKQLRVFEKGQKARIFKECRCLVRLHDYSEARPRKELEWAWRAFKRVTKASRQKALVLDIRLDEHFGSRAFMLHFRYFKTWERAFQVRKMEEHLCGQNLMAYEHAQKQNCVRNWKLLTAQKMFQQYLNLVNRRKSFFAKWRSYSKQLVKERNQRAVQRVFTAWRSQGQDNKLDPLRDRLEQRRKAKLFDKWKRYGDAKSPRVRYSAPERAEVVTPWFVHTPPPPPRFSDTNVRKARTLQF